MKEIPGFPSYLISENGEIVRKSTLRPLKIRLNKITGYLETRIYNEQWVSKKKCIHRLVAYTYLNKVDGKNKINHKDSNRLNNHISNLEWCTSSENNTHAYKTGNKIPPWKGRFGIDNPKSFPIECISIINGEKTQFGSIAEASRNGFPSVQLIINCCKGKKRYYKGYYWRYNN